MNNYPSVTLYKHINNSTVAVEVLRFFRVPGKASARVKVRWWNINSKRPPYCMGTQQWLTDASIVGNKRKRGEYPIEKWYKEWEPYNYVEEGIKNEQA